ncbi:MAG: hypothetical protein GY714_31975, partial [Desulfobacterales bacterium]|nr:hypothetical protein [Desulfobacterales bacterium]
AMLFGKMQESKKYAEIPLEDMTPTRVGAEPFLEAPKKKVLPRAILEQIFESIWYIFASFSKNLKFNFKAKTQKTMIIFIALRSILLFFCALVMEKKI